MRRQRTIESMIVHVTVAQLTMVTQHRTSVLFCSSVFVDNHCNSLTFINAIITILHTTALFAPTQEMSNPKIEPLSKIAVI